jgi:hypothetical protein
LRLLAVFRGIGDEDVGHSRTGVKITLRQPHEKKIVSALAYFSAAATKEGGCSCDLLHKPQMPRSGKR